MEKLYERLKALLGEQYDSPAFRNFVSELGMEPIVVAIGANLDVAFPELGVSFITWAGAFRAVHMHIDTPSTPKLVKPYDGDLEAGITRRDRSEIVKKKLGMEPSKTRRSPRYSNIEWDLRELYDIGKFRVSFSFDGVTGSMYFASVSTRTPCKSEEEL